MVPALSYLFLNVLFGAVGHLAVEPLPDSCSRRPLLRHIAGASFHAQHHQGMGQNFGFYTLLWDRLLGTLSPDYERDYGRIPGWSEEEASSP
jgi:sterol desaturase/sphingolipid hydroxylase (fatty acid hydroxylase superfamily)